MSMLHSIEGEAAYLTGNGNFNSTKTNVDMSTTMDPDCKIAGLELLARHPTIRHLGELGIRRTIHRYALTCITGVEDLLPLRHFVPPILHRVQMVCTKSFLDRVPPSPSPRCQYGCIASLVRPLVSQRQLCYFQQHIAAKGACKHYLLARSGSC